MKLPTSIVVMHMLFACAYCRNTLSPCGLNQFYNVENEKCTDCTECPSDTIVLTTCGWFSDIKCQPLAGLKFDYIVPQNSAKWTSKGDKKSTLSRNTSVMSKENDEQEHFNSHQWFTIAMILLGILCFLSVCLAAYIVIACFVCRNKNKDKEIIYNPVFIPRQPDEEPRYVDVFAPSSRDRLKQHQHRSLTTRMNNGTVSTFQSTSALPLLQSQNSENIYVNCLDYFPNDFSENKSKDTNDYVYLESN